MTTGSLQRTVWMVGLSGALLLSACGEKEVILPGARENLRDVLSEQDTPTAPALVENLVRPFASTRQSANSEWTQSSGSPATRINHPALGANLTHVWSNNIGAGDSRKTRITADPVVGGGRIYTLDSQAQVVATSTGGGTVWTRDLTPARDRATDASGGGLAYAKGRVYVASGFGLMTALDAATGAIVWQQKLDSSATGSPTVSGGIVYLTSGDDLGWAINADTGRIAWQLSANPDHHNVMGAPAPAITDKLAIFAYGSGEVQAAERKTGTRLWDTVVSGQRRGFARSNVLDITADPVVVGDTIYLGTMAGRVMAIDIKTGERLWTANEGAISPVWVSGGSVFLISDRNELLRLDASDGSRVWGTKLPFFTKNRPKRQKEIFAHYGPVLAGGRLVVTSSDGQIRSFDPKSGALIGTTAVPGGATTNPVIAGRTLYVVSTKGQLHAFR